MQLMDDDVRSQQLEAGVPLWVLDGLTPARHRGPCAGHLTEWALRVLAALADSDGSASHDAIAAIMGTAPRGVPSRASALIEAELVANRCGALALTTNGRRWLLEQRQQSNPVWAASLIAQPGDFTWRVVDGYQHDGRDSEEPRKYNGGERQEPLYPDEREAQYAAICGAGHPRVGAATPGLRYWAEVRRCLWQRGAAGMRVVELADEPATRFYAPGERAPGWALGNGWVGPSGVR
ncbi:MAG TPA: hypothetical protein VGO80_10975 [Solirubrobacteraceae bacterium]|jgi:hypothetical protein|nr:hypothetical protein [Solirubrobacteraceae bacterium]